MSKSRQNYPRCRNVSDIFSEIPIMHRNFKLNVSESFQKFPRCCKTTGVDDHCECKGNCLSHEYQKDDCTGGYVCCPRTMRGYDVHPQ